MLTLYTCHTIAADACFSRRPSVDRERFTTERVSIDRYQVRIDGEAYWLIDRCISDDGCTRVALDLWAITPLRDGD